MPNFKVQMSNEPRSSEMGVDESSPLQMGWMNPAPLRWAWMNPKCLMSKYQKKDEERGSSKCGNLRCLR